MARLALLHAIGALPGLEGASGHAWGARIAMTTDDTPRKRRQPAGGFDLDDDEGQILGIDGVLYRYTNGELVEIGSTGDGLNRPTLDPEDEKALDEGERNPHGNPYRKGEA